MSTIKVSLQNGIVIEGLEPNQLIDILQKLDSSQVSNKEKIKQENAILKPQIEAELKKLQTKITRNKKALENNKEVIPDLPVTANLATDQRKLLHTAFYYAPNKSTSKGKAPYIAAILMDGKVYTLAHLKSIVDAPTTTVLFAIERLREAGCIVDTSTSNLIKNTLIHLSSIGKPKSKLYIGQANSPKIAIPKAQKTSGIAKNSSIIIPKKFTNLTV